MTVTIPQNKTQKGIIFSALIIIGVLCWTIPPYFYDLSRVPRKLNCSVRYAVRVFQARKKPDPGFTHDCKM